MRYFHLLRQPLPVIEHPSKIIKGARQVVFSAIGASYNAWISVINQLCSVGVAVQLLDAAKFLNDPGKINRTNAVNILVSFSGEQVEIIKLIMVLRQNKAKVIGVMIHGNNFTSCNWH